VELRKSKVKDWFLSLRCHLLVAILYKGRGLSAAVNAFVGCSGRATPKSKIKTPLFGASSGRYGSFPSISSFVSGRGTVRITN